MEEGRCELVNDGHRITDEVWLEPTPGHTPGHSSIRISSKGTDAVITGDMINHPIQFRHPEWDNNFDCDGKQAKATRRAFGERYAEKPVAERSVERPSAFSSTFPFASALACTAYMWGNGFIRSSYCAQRSGSRDRSPFPTSSGTSHSPTYPAT
jgi:hypothetical protein